MRNVVERTAPNTITGRYDATASCPRRCSRCSPLFPLSPSADARYRGYGTRSIVRRLRETVRRSKSSWRAVICV
jgi:hypothetical protein